MEERYWQPEERRAEPDYQLKLREPGSQEIVAFFVLLYGEKMKNFPSIKKNRDFQEVYRLGKSYANKQLVMYVKKTGGPGNRIGISVSKKVGNSVVRHRLTRLLREAFRLHNSTLKHGSDIVVVVRATAKEADYKIIERAFMHLCGLHNIVENRSEYD